MTQQTTFSVENNFTKGLITESTGLNFPENASTDTDNCTYTLIGEVLRREGIDFESNFLLNDLGTRTGNAISTYKWNNAGGDGNTQIVVTQIGGTLYFFKSSIATATAPLSTTKLAATVTLSTFLPTGSSSTVFDTECQYADGNGYLFVYHPSLDPFYCALSGNTITPAAIVIKTRDFAGIPETSPINFRPPGLSTEHNYNLQNQGWQYPASWSASSTSTPNLIVDSNGNWTVGNTVFTIASGLTIVNGSFVTITGQLQFTQAGTIGVTILGQVASYSGTSLSITIITCITSPQAKANLNNLISANWQLVSAAANNQITTWQAAIGNYPSNSDVWWIYKNTSGVFSPSTTINNFPPPTSPASKGHFILNEFQQQRSSISGISGITDVSTFTRPRTGAWFQGRVWFTGVDSSVPPSGDMPYTTWTENIYFSQIIVRPEQFGWCYQQNDSTDQNLFGLLPTDGGVITIQGSGSIYKLFPIVNGLLVFAGNGVWFITGSRGIGFTANDYTVTKLSNIESISSTSFVNVMGMPYFWNEEGIYAVETQQTGNLNVNPITVGTILTFYGNIPKQSKRYVRGAYHPIDYTIQWIYKSTNETSVTDRYSFDRILNFNVYNKAFFPYSVASTPASLTYINSITFIQSPGGSTAPDPEFKYFCTSNVSGNFLATFADENNISYVDWASTNLPVNYASFFVTGYKLRGQAIRKFQPQYIQMWSKVNTEVKYSGYTIQSLWDYSVNRNSGRWSTEQQVYVINNTNFGLYKRRHRLRGSGQAVQFKITSNDGIPFNVSGWAVYDTVNAQV